MHIGAATFRSEAFWHKSQLMTANFASNLVSPTMLSAAVRYYRNAVETG
jgi:hypothetical protein